MKFYLPLLVLLVFLLSGFANLGAAQNPNAGLTRDQIVLYRVAGIQKKADAAIAQLDGAKSETKAVQAKYDAALATIETKNIVIEDLNGIIDWWKVKDKSDYDWGARWEQATKAISVFFAVALAGWIGTIFAGQILKNFPTVEGPIASCIVYVLIFLAAYYAIVTCIYTIAPFIPTPPLWHDITHLFQGAKLPKIK